MFTIRQIIKDIDGAVVMIREQNVGPHDTLSNALRRFAVHTAKMMPLPYHGTATIEIIKNLEGSPAIERKS